MDLGKVSGAGVARCSWTAGIARATKAPPDTAAQSAGRRMTRSTMAPHMRPLPSSRRSRRTSGTRSRSTLSPSLESNAGSTVSEPSTAIATTAIVANAIEAKISLPVRNMPAIAVMTIRPETSTERPDVAAAASNCGSLAPAGGTLLPLPPQVEHRVVDADGEADQEHDAQVPASPSAGNGWTGRRDRRSRTRRSGARSSGIPAATRAPKAITRMMSVIGRESSPAFARSSA